MTEHLAPSSPGSLTCSPTYMSWLSWLPQPLGMHTGQDVVEFPNPKTSHPLASEGSLGCLRPGPSPLGSFAPTALPRLGALAPGSTLTSRQFTALAFGIQLLN